jgi:hypothetical protein
MGDRSPPSHELPPYLTQPLGLPTKSFPFPRPWRLLGRLDEGDLGHRQAYWALPHGPRAVTLPADAANSGGEAFRETKQPDRDS